MPHIWDTDSPMAPGAMREQTVAELAENEFCKRMRVEGLAERNVAGLSWEERKAAAIEYAEARAAHAAAVRELEAAINGGS